MPPENIEMFTVLIGFVIAAASFVVGRKSLTKMIDLGYSKESGFRFSAPGFSFAMTLGILTMCASLYMIKQDLEKIAATARAEAEREHENSKSILANLQTLAVVLKVDFSSLPANERPNIKKTTFRIIKYRGSEAPNYDSPARIIAGSRYWGVRDISERIEDVHPDDKFIVLATEGEETGAEHVWKSNEVRFSLETVAMMQKVPE